MRDTLNQMFECLGAGPEVYQPSKFWQQLNEKNISQLETTGLENVKRTLAQNYFTWVVGMRSPLFRRMASLTRRSDWFGILKSLPAYSSEFGLGVRRFYELQIFTRMIWLVAQHGDSRKLLDRVEEPSYGNPFRITFQNRLISQDLANSMMEYYAITQADPPQESDSFTVCELGAGYGRNAYFFMNAHPHCKYVIVDIPPALYVSQEYLANVLPERRVMRFRPFDDFAEVQEEFDRSDIVFLLPHQAERLKAKSIDMFVNISSLHEMTIPQIDTYFGLVDRLTRGHFYTKQWHSFHNVRDNITITERDYPYRTSWKQVYTRTPDSHPQFFEALYKVA